MNNQSYFWKFIERLGAQLVTFVTSIFLARILNVSDYGIVSVVMIFILISDVLIYNGLPTTLVQKKNVTSTDYKTAFTLNLLLGILLYFIIIVIAFIIDKSSSVFELKFMMIVLGLKVVIDSLGSVVQANVSRNFLFKKSFIASLTSSIVSGIVGIYLALNGVGAWALIFQSLLNSSLNLILLSILTKFMLSFNYNKNSALSLLAYGWKISVSALIDSLFNQTRKILIATQYSSTDLAFVNKGNQFPELFMSVISGTISSVAFPIMSRVQNDINEIKSIVRNSIRISTFIIFPLLGGLVVIGDQLIILLLTEKWIQSYQYLIIASIAFMTWPIQIFAQNAIKSLGLSNIYLKIEITRKFFGVLILIIAFYINLYAIVVSLIISELISTIIILYYSNEIYSYRFKEQFFDILPSVALTTMMMTSVYLLNFEIKNLYLSFITSILIGAFTYVSLSILFKPKAYIELKKSIIIFIKEKKI